MVNIIALGMVSALFFSSTFVLNGAMSLEGGHWVWTAGLRFGYMLVFLSVCILFTKGAKQLSEIWGGVLNTGFSGSWQEVSASVCSML